MSIGDTGSNLVEWIKFLLGRNLEIPHVKFIYPTAPVQRLNSRKFLNKYFNEYAN